MVDGGGGIGGGSMDSLGVLGSSLVGHISNISIITIGGVGDMLDSAVRKSNRVGSLGIAGTIRGLLGVEVSLGVVIGNSVGVGVGGNLIGVNLSLVGRGGGMVSRGSVDNRGVISGGGVDGVSHNRGSVDGVSDDRSSVHGVSHGVGDNRGVDGVSHGVDSVGSNHRGVDSVGQGSMDGVSNSHGGSVGDNSGSNMRGEVSRAVDNTAMRDGGMVANISGGQTKESGNDESLKPSTC